MEIKDFFNLIVPLVGVAGGIVIKYSNYEQTNNLKKYWWLIVLISLMSFVLRLYNYVNK